MDIARACTFETYPRGREVSQWVPYTLRHNECRLSFNLYYYLLRNTVRCGAVATNSATATNQHPRFLGDRGANCVICPTAHGCMTRVKNPNNPYEQRIYRMQQRTNNLNLEQRHEVYSFEQARRRATATFREGNLSSGCFKNSWLLRDKPMDQKNQFDWKQFSS